MKRIILASNSPRRRELLAGLGLAYEVRVLEGIDESFPDELQGGEVAAYISRVKAEAYQPTMADDELVITADTIVCLDDKVLGKPADEAEAIEMLHRLSGCTHQVYTGVTLIRTGDHPKVITFAEKTDVHLYPMSGEEINAYIATKDPMDKAGAYGIQGDFAIHVKGIEGDYYNVVGLPIGKVYQELKRLL